MFVFSLSFLDSLRALKLFEDPSFSTGLKFGIEENSAL